MNEENVADLVTDYRKWGRARVMLVVEGIRKWGVIFQEFCNGESG